MKRILALIFITILAGYYCGSQKESSEQAEEEQALIPQEVKFMSREVSMFNYDNLGVKQLEMKIKELFNGKGRKEREKQFYVPSDGTPFVVISYSYNTHDRLIEEYSHSPLESWTNIIKYTYNDKGNQMEKSVSMNNSISTKTRHNYTFDTNGKIKKEVITGENNMGKVDRRIAYKYDGNGNLIETVSTNADGSMFEKKVYFYNSKGILSEKKLFIKEGSDQEELAKSYEYTDFNTFTMSNAGEWEQDVLQILFPAP